MRTVEETVAALKDRSIIVFRRHHGAWALWEGSDFDLDSAYEAALGQTKRGTLADRLNRFVPLRPVVARAHYIETGTLRVQIGRASCRERV